MDGSEACLKHLVDHVRVERGPEARSRRGRALEGDLQQLTDETGPERGRHQPAEPPRESLRPEQPLLLRPGDRALSRQPDEHQEDE
jgi:hypothetical protein